MTPVSDDHPTGPTGNLDRTQSAQGKPIAVITQPDLIQATIILSNSTLARAPPHQPIRVN
jgi:hypothetical protein